MQLSLPQLPATLAAPRASRCGHKAAPAAQQGRWAAAAALAGRRRLPLRAAADSDRPSSTEPEADPEGGLLPEEDAEVPGTYRDAMSSNTQLGKAVKGACDELDALGSLERQTLEEAEGLLKKLGFKGSLFTGAPQPQAGEDAQE